jgi:hypothetical protein
MNKSWSLFYLTTALHVLGVTISHLQNPVRQHKLITDMESDFCIFRCIQSQEHDIVLYLYRGLELRTLDIRFSQW